MASIGEHRPKDIGQLLDEETSIVSSAGLEPLDG